MNSQKIVFLENLRSLHNVGSIFRTCDGAGWDGVILGGYTGAPPDRRIEKVSLGAEDFIIWEKCEDSLAKIKELKAEGYLILGLEQTSQSQNLFEFKNTTDLELSKAVLILGNEVEGISPEILSCCDVHLEIPMRGQKGSLNVSIAAGVALYQLSASTS